MGLGYFGIGTPLSIWPLATSAANPLSYVWDHVIISMVKRGRYPANWCHHNTTTKTLDDINVKRSDRCQNDEASQENFGHVEWSLFIIVITTSDSSVCVSSCSAVLHIFDKTYIESYLLQLILRIFVNSNACIPIVLKPWTTGEYKHN